MRVPRRHSKKRCNYLDLSCNAVVDLDPNVVLDPIFDRDQLFNYFFVNKPYQLTSLPKRKKLDSNAFSNEKINFEVVFDQEERSRSIRSSRIFFILVFCFNFNSMYV